MGGRSRHDGYNDAYAASITEALKPQLYREIEIKFDFEHAFGFFSRLTGHVEQRPSPRNVRSLPAFPEPHPRRPRAGSLCERHPSIDQPCCPGLARTAP
jgi:hypothetical protein